MASQRGTDDSRALREIRKDSGSKPD